MEARLEALTKEWKAGKFKPAYHFFGESAAVAGALKDLKAALLCDDFNLSVFSNEIDAGAIVADALTPPAFSPRRLIIVDNPKLAAGARQIFAEYLATPLETTTIAFISDEKRPDPKDVLARAVGACGSVCLIGPLGEEEAQRRLQEEAKKAGKTLDMDAAAAMVQEAGTDWMILRQELEKALLFAQGASVTRQDVLACLGYQKALDPFALPRLIQGRSLKESLTYLRKLFETGKPDDQAFKALNQITGAVTRQFKAKRLVKAGTSSDMIFKMLRLNSYYDRDYLAQVGKRSEAGLRRDLEACLQTEVSLKSKAWLDPRMEVEHLVIALCGTAA